MTGRGAWTKVGFPAGSGPYYTLAQPINIGSQPNLDQAHRAVTYGVKAIQTRLNELRYTPALTVDGWLGPLTATAIVWAQHQLNVTADGQAGPHTLQAMLWPVIQQVAGTNAHTVGGIASHESGFDPGAVGELDDHDIGLVQINGPANPTLTEAQRFDYHVAFKYCADRIAAALNTYHNIDYAIASYANPSWAQTWSKTGTAPNQDVVAYVNYVKAWAAPS